MTLRDPFLRISGPGGAELVRDLGADFIGARITDLEGGESDELLIRIRRNKPFRMPPPPDTEFRVLLGWEERGAIVTGTYRFERVTYTGEPGAGEEMGLVCRAPDGEALKRIDTEHFDEETGHKTYGDVLRTLASKAGLGAAIDPTIAKIPLAGGYLLRWKQSAIGLATDMADELGAIVKPQAGMLTVRRRGSGLSASGARLSTIAVRRDPSYAWQADIDKIYGFGSAASSWFDPGKGRTADIVKSIAGGVATFALPHLAASQAFARAITEAAAQRLRAESATAVFEMPGNADAVAGSPVAPQGYGPDVDALPWEAKTVTHDVDPGDRGWITTVECQLGDEA